ncbi:MAG: ABC transporter ATP-binding protein [Cellulosilyticaceae bacterium]
MSNTIIIKNLTKKYGKHTALNHISLELHNGMFGLLGANGAGKTTLMNIITTLIDPTSGVVIVNGKDVVKEKLAVRELVGFLPQDFNVYPELTAFEFMDYIARLNQIKNKKERQSLIETLLEKVNLSHVANKKIGGFSGGMRRRLGIAQALIKDPQILIVDEPTAGLDPEERIRFRTMLVELSKDKIVILSTHIVEDISASCEHIALLNEGNIVFAGTPKDFITTASDKIFEVIIKNTDDLVTLKNNYQIISLRQTTNHMLARIIANADCGFTPCEPNLEDAYLYFMNTHKEDTL